MQPPRWRQDWNSCFFLFSSTKALPPCVKKPCACAHSTLLRFRASMRNPLTGVHLEGYDPLRKCEVLSCAPPRGPTGAPTDG